MNYEGEVLNLFKRNGNKKIDPIDIAKYFNKDYKVDDLKK
mgnify:CR=1 FL=1